MRFGRFRFVYCAAMLMIALLCLCAASAEELTMAEDSTELFQCGGLPEVSMPVAFFSSGTDSFDDYVAQQLGNCVESFSVSDYRITPEEFKVLYGNLLNNRPDLFFVQAGWQYSYNTLGYVINIWPSYKYPAAELPDRIAAFEASVREIADHASAASTDLGKLMLVNDYFCVHFDYDDTLSKFAPDELFSTGTGVCQAIMLGCKAVLDELDISSTAVTSVAMNHAWNIVQLDGEWYHLDVTWNDSDYQLMARHNYFLMSDKAFSTAGHFDWLSPVEAGSEIYDDAFWQDVHTPISVSGKNFYYAAAGESEEMRTLMKWTEDGGSAALHSYSILDDDGAYWDCVGYDGVALGGGRLYYSAANRLYSIPVVGGEPRLEYEDPDIAMGVWRPYAENGVLHFLVSDSPEGTGTIHTVMLGTAASVMIFPEVLEMTVGETAQIIAAITPSQDGKALAWSSSDSSVVSVDENGAVSAMAPGAVRITAACEGVAEGSAVVVVHSATQVVLPAGTTHVCAGAFHGTAAEEIVLPEGVVSVGEGVFADCGSLKLVILPASLTEIAADAFDGCMPVILCPPESAAAEAARESGLVQYDWPVP